MKPYELLLKEIADELQTIGRSKIYYAHIEQYCSDKQFWDDFQKYWKNSCSKNNALIFSFNDLQIDENGKYIILYRDGTFYKKYYEYPNVSNKDIINMPEEKRRKPWTW